ncbi:Testis-expressed sequence 10 protein [Globisporangium polare]
MAKAKVASKVKKKPADFKRPKRKVGRKAPQSANVTSVAISSRRINMLEQSVLQEKGEAVTHRNLSLQDLMQQMGHYNAHIRQRALQGLRELVQTHASNVLANVSVVLERFLPTFVDEEAIVRDAAVSTWKVLVPALMAGKSLKPFAKLITVYFCSGLTHLQIGVRQDTLRAIGALLEVSPELISVEAGLEQLGRLIENFRDLIAATQAQGIKVTNSYDLLSFKKSSSSASTASGGAAGSDAAGKARSSSQKKTSAGRAGALTLRFAALKVLHRLLASIDFSAADVTSRSDANARINTLQAGRTASIANTTTMLLYPTPVLVANNQSEQLRNVGFWQQKSRSLLQPLLDLWIECLEGEVDTLSEEYVEHMQYIIESVTVVLAANREFMAANPDHELCRIARRLQEQLMLKFPLFPEHNIVNSGDAYLSTWYGINVAISKFACVFLKMPAKFQSSQLEGRIFTFVVSTFAKYEASDELRSLGGTHMIIRSLLEVVTLLLSANSARMHRKTPPATAEDVEKSRVTQEELLECFTKLYNKSSSKSVTFRICTAFVLEQLATLKPWPKWEIIMQWMTCFGNLLGYLELAHMELGRQCLFTMISVIKQLPAEWAAEQQMQGIMANLVNFFNLAAQASVPETESKKKPMTQFDALRAEDQMEFVSLIYHLPRYPVELLRALSSCCKSDRVDFNAKSFLMDILFQRRECLDIAHLVSFLMSSVLARTSSSSSTASLSAIGKANQLHLQLVHHVCHILGSMSLGATLSQILAPALARQAAILDAMQVVDLHTLVLLYRVCFSSASSTRGVVSADIPKDMEQQVLALGLKVVREFAQQQSAQQDGAERALVSDFMDILAFDANILMPLLAALVGNAKERSDNVSSEQLAKRLRAFQVLARTTSLNARFMQNQQQVLALLQELEAAVQSDSTRTATMNDEIPRLIRQLQGDLQLVAVGKSAN